jgi:hypothetical protein
MHTSIHIYIYVCALLLRMIVFRVFLLVLKSALVSVSLNPCLPGLVSCLECRPCTPWHHRSCVRHQQIKLSLAHHIHHIRNQSTVRRFTNQTAPMHLFTIYITYYIIPLFFFFFYSTHTSSFCFSARCCGPACKTKTRLWPKRRGIC